MSRVLEHEECVTALHDATVSFADRSDVADLRLPVPSCPGWDVSRLVAHLGDVHRWAANAIIEAVDSDDDFGPPAGAVLPDWYRESAGWLLDAIRSTPGDREIWTFGPPPHRVDFWSRRQLHETMVHLWDLEAAMGQPGRIDDRVAADGVDEVCTMFYPRQVRLGRTAPLEATVVLDDGEHRCLLGESDTPDVTVSGAASDLMLLVWKRIGLDDAAFTVSGSRAVLEDVLARRITP